jgi:hypothetical protein
MGCVGKDTVILVLVVNQEETIGLGVSSEEKFVSGKGDVTMKL